MEVSWSGRDAIDNCAEADEWKAKGQTFAALRGASVLSSRSSAGHAPPYDHIGITMKPPAHPASGAFYYDRLPQMTERCLAAIRLGYDKNHIDGGPKQKTFTNLANHRLSTMPSPANVGLATRYSAE